MLVALFPGSSVHKLKLFRTASDGKLGREQASTGRTQYTVSYCLPIRIHEVKEWEGDHDIKRNNFHHDI